MVDAMEVVTNTVLSQCVALLRYVQTSATVHSTLEQFETAGKHQYYDVERF